MKSKHIFQSIKSWSSDNKNESEITQELVIEPDPYRMACAIVIKTFSRILLLMNIGTRAANLVFILTQPVFIRTRWVNMTKKRFSFLRKEFPILLKIFTRNAFLQEEFSSIQCYCRNFSKLIFNHYFLLP